MKRAASTSDITNKDITKEGSRAFTWSPHLLLDDKTVAPSSAAVAFFRGSRSITPVSMSNRFTESPLTVVRDPSPTCTTLALYHPK